MAGGLCGLGPGWGGWEAGKPGGSRQLRAIGRARCQRGAGRPRSLCAGADGAEREARARLTRSRRGARPAQLCVPGSDQRPRRDNGKRCLRQNSDHRMNREEVNASAALATLTEPSGFRCYLVPEHSHRPRWRPGPPPQPLATTSLPSARRHAWSRQEPSRKGIGVSRKGWGAQTALPPVAHTENPSQIPPLGAAFVASFSLSLPCEIRSRKGLRNKTHIFLP